MTLSKGLQVLVPRPLSVHCQIPRRYLCSLGDICRDNKHHYSSGLPRSFLDRPSTRTCNLTIHNSSSPGAKAFSTSSFPQSQHKTHSPSNFELQPKYTFSRNRTLLSRRPVQANLISWAAAFLFCGTVILYSVLPRTPKTTSEPTSLPRQSSDREDKSEIDSMTGEALAGRPGTLTPEQEEKLKEFWVATLSVFGVLDAREFGAITPNSRNRSDTASSKKQKKKRLSMFRRNKDDDDESVTSTESGSHTPSADTDDKYGQTKEFHDALASQSPESLRATFWSMVKHDHPDALLLRFLRARKWDVEKALVMMVSTMSWRSTTMHVDDDIMKHGELELLEDTQGSDVTKANLGRDFLQQMRLGKSYLHGSDKENRPMCFVRVRLHKQGEQSEESLERYTVFIIESARMVLSPPVDTATVVFDMTGFSLANMDYAPVKFMIRCFEANYPESLGTVLVHKAPWVFQGIWKIIRGWLDPVVASKVHFTNNNEEMEVFVPKSHIIKELNGDEDWSYHYVEPQPGENDKMKDTATRDKLLLEREELVKGFEKATVEWIQGGISEVDGLKKKRNESANGLRDDYWRLDPYIRARSYYDRIGMINPGGKIDFYPTAAPAPASNGIVKVETSVDDVD